MRPLSKRLDIRHKNNKFLYYLKVLGWQLIPGSFYQSQLNKKLSHFSSLPESEQTYIRGRVDYYNKLFAVRTLNESAITLKNFRLPEKQRAYYFDAQEYTRYFKREYKAHFLFGDITKVPDEPSIVKSRPIAGNNENSILLNLDKLRHFNFITDNKPFEHKKNMLVGRGVVKREHRVRFYEMYFNHPMCNLGQINKNKNPHWIREFLTIEEHLDYKFILCLEGNDVATNLKWVMSSNSLAVMPKPKFETWFMEGTLVGNKHYVEIKDDYSDLEERMTYYINHPQEANEIIRNAHAYIEQFKNKQREDLISLLVLDKYFSQTQ
ncbi:MAG TPA: glycosyl transferase family 90 [Cyclobacteriaceae bacterium]|nr:lipopolysaccharide A protein [Cyclobacteriaceae bacterium]HMV10357.1 glycosyl transferase family 90 [Cyclobacteriaceae bacterium]HMV89288.1 glycosyl transferase family 90 [Cyclobacteriaceae bacterium]HMX00382.1 glycosyl transferase family 90 [Cyclobacteriaceae bacterium]HMX49619.1 glycosyl transferase family 90 [Cyclobacteriaceae bacterium]